MKKKNRVQGIQIFRNGVNNTHVIFDRCKFLLKRADDCSNDKPIENGACLWQGSEVRKDFFDRDTRDLTEFIHCEFPADAPFAILANRNGRIRTEKNKFRGWKGGVWLTHGGNNESEFFSLWESYEDDFSRCDRAPFMVDRVNEGYQEVRIHHSQWPSDWKPFSHNRPNAPLNHIRWTSTRVIIFDDSLPSSGIIGDRARRRVPKTGEPFEYLCTQTSVTDPAWVPIVE